MALTLSAGLLRSAGFRHGFSLRAGGVSTPPYDTLNLGRNVGDDPVAVARNHSLFARQVGYEPGRLYEVNQVHGGRVETIDPQVAPAQFRDRAADALVCASADCAIGVRVADCVPVLLADPESGAVAAVHAGWRGVVARVLASSVEALCALSGAPAARLLCAVFPGIGVDAFEVGEDVAAQLLASVGGASGIVRRGSGRPHVDLARAVQVSLWGAGLAPARVELIEGCTYADAIRFYSFRRDAGNTGRHLAAILPRC